MLADIEEFGSNPRLSMPQKDSGDQAIAFPQGNAGN